MYMVFAQKHLAGFSCSTEPISRRAGRRTGRLDIPWQAPLQAGSDRNVHVAKSAPNRSIPFDQCLSCLGVGGRGVDPHLINLTPTSRKTSLGGSYQPSPHLSVRFILKSVCCKVAMWI